MDTGYPVFSLKEGYPVAREDYQHKGDFHKKIKGFLDEIPDLRVLCVQNMILDYLRIDGAQTEVKKILLISNLNTKIRQEIIDELQQRYNVTPQICGPHEVHSPYAYSVPSFSFSSNLQQMAFSYDLRGTTIWNLKDNTNKHYKQEHARISPQAHFVASDHKIFHARPWKNLKTKFSLDDKFFVTTSHLYDPDTYGRCYKYSVGITIHTTGRVPYHHHIQSIGKTPRNSSRFIQYIPIEAQITPFCVAISKGYTLALLGKYNNNNQLVLYIWKNPFQTENNIPTTLSIDGYYVAKPARMSFASHSEELVIGDDRSCIYTCNTSTDKPSVEKIVHKFSSELTFEECSHWTEVLKNSSLCKIIVTQDNHIIRLIRFDSRADSCFYLIRNNRRDYSMSRFLEIPGYGYKQSVRLTDQGKCISIGKPDKHTTLYLQDILAHSYDILR